VLISLIPWNVEIPKAEQRPQDEVVTELAAEGAAILRWMLDGLADWGKDHGWCAAEVSAATAEYRRDEDRLGSFLEACCEFSRFAETPAADLYTAYETLAIAEGERCVSKTAFGKLLKQRGLTRGRAGRSRF